MARRHEDRRPGERSPRGSRGPRGRGFAGGSEAARHRQAPRRSKRRERGVVVTPAAGLGESSGCSADRIRVASELTLAGSTQTPGGNSLFRQ